MVKIYSRGHNSTNLPTPEGLKNLGNIWGVSEDLRDTAAIQIQELVSAIGVAKAFSNQPSIKPLLDKIQHKLLGLEFIIKNHVSPEDPTSQAIVNQSAVEGLANCITYFGANLPMTMKQIVPGTNKAGAMLRLSHLFANRLNSTVRKMAETDNAFVVVAGFTSNLSALLNTLERYEYQTSGLTEEYWN